MQSFSLLVILMTLLVSVSAFYAPSMRVNSRIALNMAEKKEVMGKADLVNMIKEKSGVSKKDVEAVLGAFQDSVKSEVLASGKEIRLRDFGTFKRKVSKPRTGRNPRSGEAIQISGSKSVGFSVATALKVKDA